MKLTKVLEVANFRFLVNFRFFTLNNSGSLKFDFMAKCIEISTYLHKKSHKPADNYSDNNNNNNNSSISKEVFVKHCINKLKISSKLKVGVLHPVQQPGTYWDRSSALSLVGIKPTNRRLPVIGCQSCQPLGHCGPVHIPPGH